MVHGIMKRGGLTYRVTALLCFAWRLEKVHKEGVNHVEDEGLFIELVKGRRGDG